MLPSPRPFSKKTNWLLALGVEILAPLFRRYAAWRTPSNGISSSPKSWRRALILGDNHLGDLLYRTCSLPTLKRGLPQCDFYYGAAANTAEILAGNPALKQVLPWERSDWCLDLAAQHFEQLKAMRFDAVLCTNCIRYWPELWLAIRLGVPYRVGYIYKGFSAWVTHPIPLRYPQAFPAYFRDYVSALTGLPITGPLKPELYLTPAAETLAASAFRRLSLADGAPVIAFFLTSRQDTALWPLDFFLRVFDLIAVQLKTPMVLLGAPTDHAFLTDLAKRSPARPLVCAGELNLTGLAAFLKRCKLVVAKDSGPRHLANAVGTSVLFFRSTSYSQIEAGKYCDTEVDLTPPGEFLNKSQQSDLLSTIQPGDVFQKILQTFQS